MKRKFRVDASKKIKSDELTFTPDFNTYYNRGGRAQYKVSNGDTVYEPYSFEKGTNRVDLPIDDDRFASHYTEEFEVGSKSGKRYRMTKEYRGNKEPDAFEQKYGPTPKTVHIQEIGASKEIKAAKSSPELHHYFDDLDGRFDFDLDDEFEIYLDTTTSRIPCYTVDSRVFGNGAGLYYTVVVAVPRDDTHWQMAEDVERNLEKYIKEQTDGSDYTGWVEDSDYRNARYDVPDEVFQNSELYVYDVCVVPYQNIGSDGSYGIDAGYEG